MAIGKVEKAQFKSPIQATPAAGPLAPTRPLESESAFDTSRDLETATRLGRPLETTVFPPRDEIVKALQGQTPEEIQESLQGLIDAYGEEGVEGLLNSEIASHNAVAWGANLSESYQAVADGALGATLLSRSNAKFVTEKDYGISFNDGRVSVYEIGEDNARTIRVNGASVEAAHAFAKAQISMANATEGNQFPESHWTPVEGRPGFFKSKGPTSECLKHALENPREYRADCASQTVLANYEAIRQVLGDEAFNRKFPYGITVGLSFKRTELEPFLKSDDEKARIAGEMAYVENPAPTVDAVLKGHRGQNLILMTSSSSPEQDDFSSWTPGGLSAFGYSTKRYRPIDLDSVIASVNGPDNSNIDLVELQKRQALDRSVPSKAYLTPGRTYINPDILN